MTTTCKQLMAEIVFTAQPSHSVGATRDAMNRRNFHALPVCDAQGKLVGIVTASDILRADNQSAPISSIMTRSVRTVRPDDSAFAAAAVMKAHRCHHVIVTTPDGTVIGMLSSFDLLALIRDES